LKIYLSFFSNKKPYGGMMKAIWVKKLYQDDSGASAVEYGILLACIAIMIISAVAIFGSSVRSLFVKGNENF
jgi:Flp pilus assembly pilin Flp